MTAPESADRQSSFTTIERQWYIEKVVKSLNIRKSERKMWLRSVFGADIALEVVP